MGQQGFREPRENFLQANKSTVYVIKIQVHSTVTVVQRLCLFDGYKHEIYLSIFPQEIGF